MTSLERPALQDDLSLAHELADIADALTMARYRAEDLQVETKPDLTPVTEADKAVELALREKLAEARPGDLVIGEEFGEAVAGGVAPDESTVAVSGSDPYPSTPQPPTAGTNRAWILDPIDGTKSYVRGMDTWTTLIALRVGDEVQVGLVSMPALGKRWWAVRGQGAFADGQQIQVSRIGELENAQMAWSGVEEWDDVGRFDALLELARRCWRSRGIGDAWQYMLVAEGAAEIASDPEAKLWDLAAVSIVVEEAGGRFTDMRGLPGPSGGSGLATNGLVHEAALAVLRQS